MKVVVSLLNKMITKRIKLFLLSLILSVFLSCSDNKISNTQVNQPDPNLVLNALNTVFENLNETYYQHDTQIDKEQGSYKVDCSGFANFLLENYSPESYGSFKTYTAKTRPYAKDYYEFIQQLNDSSTASENKYWQKIIELKNALPGDIIAEKYDSRANREDTGHILFIYTKPEQSTTNKHEYSFFVVDSSKSKHGEDTRGSGLYQDGCEENNCGLGKGKMFFEVDDLGQIQYYKWSSPDGNKYCNYDETCDYAIWEGISIGRIAE